MYEICKLGLKNAAFHLTLVDLLLFTTVCLQSDAQSASVELLNLAKTGFNVRKPVLCFTITPLRFSGYCL